MQHTLRFAATIACCMFAQTAWAQAIGEPAPELNGKLVNEKSGDTEKTVKLVGKRGLLVVLYFWRPSDPTSVEKLDIMARVDKLPGVDVIPISTEKKEDTERVLKAGEASFEWAAWDGAEIAEQYDVSDYPRCYLIDPNGIIAWRGHPGEVEGKIKDQIRLTPPAGADPAALRSKLQKSQSALAEKNYGRAFTLARQVIDLTAEGDEVHNKAVTQRDEVEKKIEPWLAEASKLGEQKEYDKAARIIAQMKVRMDGRDAIKPVEDEITKLRGSRDSKKALEDALRDVRADMQMEQAAELMELKRFVDADRTYREVVDKFEGAPAVEQAQTALKAMRQDPKTQEIIKAHYADMQAERWVEIGDRYAKLEFADKAREFYEKVRKEYPHSEAAKRADERLKKLPNGKKT